MPSELTLPVKAALVVAGGLVVGDAVLAPAPQPSDPGFIDTILASRAVVASVRLGVISAALFVLLSVVVLGTRGRWLTRVGPVEVSDVEAKMGATESKIANADKNIQELWETFEKLAAGSESGNLRRTFKEDR
jgi:hypothetical protein